MGMGEHAKLLKYATKHVAYFRPAKTKVKWLKLRMSRTTVLRYDRLHISCGSDKLTVTNWLFDELTMQRVDWQPQQQVHVSECNYVLYI